MLALAFLIGFALGALIFFHVGYDRGFGRAHREWVAESHARHIEHKYQLALAGLTIRGEDS